MPPWTRSLTQRSSKSIIVTCNILSERKKISDLSLQIPDGITMKKRLVMPDQFHPICHKHRCLMQCKLGQRHRALCATPPIHLRNFNLLTVSKSSGQELCFSVFFHSFLDSSQPHETDRIKFYAWINICVTDYQKKITLSNAFGQMSLLRRTMQSQNGLSGTMAVGGPIACDGSMWPYKEPLRRHCFHFDGVQHWRCLKLKGQRWLW